MFEGQDFIGDRVHYKKLISPAYRVKDEIDGVLEKERGLMKTNTELNAEIELLRKEMYNFLNVNGMKNYDDLLSLSIKLDDAIVKWVKENQESVYG